MRKPESVTTVAGLWSPPPVESSLPGGEVHVWRVGLAEAPARLQYLWHTLAEDERRRADGFRSTEHRERFVVSRGALRTILAGYAGRGPEELRLCSDAHGKPALAGESGGKTFRFNVSHSDGIGLIAVARDQEVGVDVERIRPDLDFEPIALRFFAPGEVARLQALPAYVRRGAFFACWTRKEAYLKARGEGLALPLNRFEVSLAPGEPAALLSTPDDAGEASRWCLRDLSPAPGYAAALAAEGQGWRLLCWQWQE